MLKSGNASIINFASVSASCQPELRHGAPLRLKGRGARTYRQLAVEGGPHIRANSIAPGMVVTPATQAVGAWVDGPTRDAIPARVRMRRLGRPEDIAWCVVYLASDESSWVTGANFPIDGGVMAN